MAQTNRTVKDDVLPSLCMRNLPKSLQLKWEQKPDKSIHVYLVEAEGGKMGGYRLFKQHCCLENENTDIIALDTLDISALKDLVVS